jgi:hypothetical protein
MPLPKNRCSTLFTTGYKRLAEGGCKAFCFERLLWGFLLWTFGLLAFGFGRLLEGGLAKGKRISEGK